MFGLDDMRWLFRCEIGRRISERFRRGVDRLGWFGRLAMVWDRCGHRGSSSGCFCSLGLRESGFVGVWWCGLGMVRSGIRIDVDRRFVWGWVCGCRWRIDCGRIVGFLFGLNIIKSYLFMGFFFNFLSIFLYIKIISFSNLF